MRLGPVGVYRVGGASMEPNLKPGDLVIGNRWSNPEIGQAVILKTPERYLIKRVKRLAPGQLWLEGDNQSQSSDSRQHGLYQMSAVEAVVIRKF